MSDSRGVARHTGFLLGAEVGIKIVTTTFYALLSRRVGVEGFGQWTYAMTFASLFMTPVNLGLSPLFIRETAASPASDERSGVFMTLRVLSCAAAVAALVPVAWLLSGSTSPALVLVCGVLFALSLITDLVRSVLRLQGRYVRDAVLNLVDRGGAALLAGTALLCGAALVGTAAAWTSCSVLSLTLAVLWTRASGWRWRWGAPLSAMRALIVQGAPLVVLSVFAAVYFRQDILLVRWILGPRAVGLYGAAYRVFDVFLFVPATLAVAFLPAASRASAQSPAALGKVCTDTLALAYAASLPLVVVLWARGAEILPLLFGREFVVSAMVVRVLMGTLVFSFANPILGNTLIAGHRQRGPALAVLGAALFNLALNLLLLPRLGILGAAWATLWTEILLFATQGIWVWRAIEGARVLAPAGRPLAAAAGTAAALALTHRWPLAGGLATAALTYALLAVVFGLVGRDTFAGLRGSKEGRLS